jgi:ribosomal protein S18 acetylase RimI-like enzyme
VRRATARDLPTILEIERACFRRDAWPESLFRAYLEACPGLFVIAGRAGYAVACIRRNQGEIESIAVHPRFMRRGIGAALMRFILAALKRRGVAVAALMVATGNRAAIAFYRSFGFRRTRTIPDYYGRNRPAWRMRLMLTAERSRSRGTGT